MSSYDPLSSDGDPFGPPAIPTLVGCLHCGQEYDSYRIEWRVVQTDSGPHGFWCCPIPGCDGRGFGFDILPVDPNYRDERGGWVHDQDEDYDEDDSDPDLPAGDKPPRAPDDDDDPIPW